MRILINIKLLLKRHHWQIIQWNDSHRNTALGQCEGILIVIVFEFEMGQTFGPISCSLASSFRC